jgi:hypothetical protein
MLARSGCPSDDCTLSSPSSIAATGVLASPPPTASKAGKMDLVEFFTDLDLNVRATNRPNNPVFRGYETILWPAAA